MRNRHPEHRPLRLALAALAALALATGCARADLPAPCTPGKAPAVATADLSTPEGFAAAEDDVERSADWLMCVRPDAQPDTWIAHRDLVMDWIEKHPTLGYRFTPAVVAPVHKDRRFKASMYMNMAYAIGKSRYLASTPKPDPVEAEIAGIDAMIAYYATLRAGEPELESRKLERFVRWKKRGKLEPWVAEKLAGK